MTLVCRNLRCLSQNLFCRDLHVFCVEENLTKNCACGEKETNFRYGDGVCRLLWYFGHSYYATFCDGVVVVIVIFCAFVLCDILWPWLLWYCATFCDGVCRILWYFAHSYYATFCAFLLCDILWPLCWLLWYCVTFLSKWWLCALVLCDILWRWCGGYCESTQCDPPLY